MSVSREEFESLKSKVSQLESGTKKEKKHRSPSEYNLFVGKKCQELKVENPSLKQSEIFELAVKAWKEQKAIVVVEEPKDQSKAVEEPKVESKKTSKKK